MVFLFATVPVPLAAQKVVQVRLTHPGADSYAFVPAKVTVRPGDRLEFTVESGGPYIIGFEPADLGPREQALLDAAIPDHSGLLRSPVLARAGSRVQVVLPDLPKGQYRFSALTHVAYRMAGVVVVP
jgi:plastocyanin